MNEIDSTRAKMLGDLIRSAREHERRSIAECAEVLGVSPEDFDKAEAGEYLLSLPDLEALAIFLDVPMGYFWGSESLGQELEVDYDNFMALRHRIIGALLSQLRLRERRSEQELADELGVDLERIRSYETGETPIPYLHLEQLSRALNASIHHFLDDQRGPLRRHEAEQRLQKQFNQLSPEMQAFLCNPVNVSYLTTAKRLSEMDVAKLRQVAENILEITL